MSKELNKPRIVIGTHNLFKIQEVNFFLDGLDIVQLSLTALPTIPEIIEDGETLLDNANKKAQVISGFTNHLVIATDAGVAIPALKDWDYRIPRRNLGENATGYERAARLLELMSGLCDDQRIATYQMALSLASRGEILWSREFFGYQGRIVEQTDLTNILTNREIGRLWYVDQFATTEDRLTEEQCLLLRSAQLPVKRDLQNFLRQFFRSRSRAAQSTP